MKRLSWLLLLLSGFLLTNVAAEQSRTFGDYTINYSAFTTDHLTPDIAKFYKIQRSKNRVMVNISIRKSTPTDKLGVPVKAQVQGTVKNLNEQLQNLDMREIVEEGAVYYIADTPFNNEDTLRYDFTITPEGETQPMQISFQDKFYSE